MAKFFSRCRAALKVLIGVEPLATQAQFNGAVQATVAKVERRLEQAAEECVRMRAEMEKKRDEHNAAAADYRRASEILMVALNSGYVQLTTAAELSRRRN